MGNGPSPPGFRPAGACVTITKLPMFRIATSLIFLTMAGCSTLSESRQHELTVGLAGDIVSLDRAKVSDATSWSVLGNVQQNLIEIDSGSRKPTPLLCERWDTAPDGKEITFYLRPNVIFHDGRPLQARDVEYSLKRFLDPSTAAPVRQWLASIKEVTTVDDHTVRITLNKPEPNLLNVLAVVPGIVPDGWGKDSASDPIGTGPFRFVRWDRGRELVLGRFDRYWRKTPVLDRVSFRVVADENARVLALKTGEVDVVFSSSLSLSNVRDLEKAGFLLDEKPVAGLQYLAGDVSSPPFSSRLFREALTYAIDRQAIVDSLFGGRVVSAAGPLPTVFAENSKAVPVFPFDPEKARQLVARSGQKLDPANPLELSYGTEWPWNEQLAQVLEANLKAAGIPVRARKYEWSTFVSALFERKLKFFTVDLIAAHGGYSLFLGEVFGSSSPLNFFHYRNASFDAAWKDVVDGPPSGRASALVRAQQVLAEDHAAVFLFGSKFGVVSNPRIKNLRIGALQELVLKDVEFVQP